MANTITGRMLIIGDIEEIQSKNGGSVFQKRNIVLNCTRSDFGQVFENYPCFELFGKHLNDTDNFNVNDIVTVSFSIKGTKVVNVDGSEKFFNTVSCYKIEKYKRKDDAKENENKEGENKEGENKENNISLDKNENRNMDQEAIEDLPF